MKKLVAIVMIIIAVCVLRAQSGSWNPAGADTSFPRTLNKNANLTAIRNSLSSNENIYLFSGIYSNASLPIPEGTSDAARLQKSHIAKNAAFIIWLGKKYSSGSVIELPQDESEQLQAKCIAILDSFAVDVDRIIVSNPAIYDSWQWRSKELIDFSIAYDLLKGTGVHDSLLVNAKARIQTFAGNLYLESTRLIAPPMYPVSFFDLVFNNHAIMTASALGMAALVINTAQSADPNAQPQSWINAAMWNLENVLFLDSHRQSEPNVFGGYAEGPGYLRYGLLNYLPFIRAMGNFLPSGSLQYTYKTVTRSIPNPYFDARYQFLYGWAAKIRMPDGRLPAIEDTYMHDYFPELALAGNSDFIWRNSFSRVKRNNSLAAQLTSSNTDMRANYIASLPSVGSSTDSLFQSLPTSGNLVFRSAFDSNAVYMHVTGKNSIARANSYGHNQADVSSFLLYAGGEVLALDPGYIRYSRRSETGNAANHNMILVDGAGPQIGDLQNSNDADGFIQNAFDKEKLDYGEVQTSYQNASITRRFLFIRNKYFINSDYVSASSNHDFAWQLHGYGIEGGTAGDEGSFTDNLANGEGIWTKGTMSLLAHTAVEGGASSYSKTTAEHEYDFDSARTHTVMLAVKNSVSSTGFLSALYPYSSAPAQITTLNSSYYTALRVNDSPYADIAAMKQDTILRTMDTSVTHLPRSLSSDGTFLLLSHKTTVDMNEQWFAIGAKHLYYGADSLFTANARVTLSVQQTSDYQLSGYCSQAAEIVIFVGANAQSVNGNNISSWLFINQDYISITFSGESYFKINTSTPLPVELTAFNAERTSSGVLLNWATATEVNLQEFQIERKSGTGNWMKIGFIPGHGNSSTPQEYSFPDDNVVAGENHYRLKMVDFDGTFHYSKELLINIPPIRSYALYQNYPNPFNPTTTISYQIPQAGLVTLKVYDMLGREVATLVNSHQEVGSYNVTFDANKLNSGVYFYTLQAGEFAATKKLLLLK